MSTEYRTELVSKRTWQTFEYRDGKRYRAISGKHRQASLCAKEARALLKADTNQDSGKD